VAERFAVVHAALTSLPLLQLAVISLRDIEGWRPDEICATVGLSGVQVRMLLHEARRTVSQALGASHTASQPSATHASAC
jgi:DNA-directed RNA polymerase specialized sigma24 family protein